ncbi:MAG: HNH endonuclease [Planctomycetes bacterium]|nr:HNH endonuclease [Planctomycetota bacterium]
MNEEAIREAARTEAGRELLLRALHADGEVRKAARGEGMLDLAIGETLLRLFEGGKLADLGISTQKAYATDRLGVPVRAVYEWTRLARTLKDRPLLRRAVVCGAITANKAMLLQRVAKAEAEAGWISLAMGVTYTELEQRVDNAYGHNLMEEFCAASLYLSMTPEQQDLYEQALRAAAGEIGFGAPRWMCQEAIAMEWLAGHADLIPDDAPIPLAIPTRVTESARWDEAREPLEKHLRALEEAQRITVDDDLDLCHSGRELDRRARRLLACRRTIAEPLGRLLDGFFKSGYWGVLGCRSPEEYVQERLGMAPRTAFQRVWLERRMNELPPIREALVSGKLTFSKALIVARRARPEDVEERIAKATMKSCQDVERAATEEEDREDRARGHRRVWGPREAMVTVAMSIQSAKDWWLRETGETLDDGKALALTGAYFIVEDQAHAAGRPRRRRRRWIVMMRKDGLCQTPMCGGRAVHGHHIRFRSHRGGDEVTNQIGLCAFCHNLVHLGFLKITGLAGDRLLFEFAGPDDPAEIWVTEGENDTRKIWDDSMEIDAAEARAATEDAPKRTPASDQPRRERPRRARSRNPASRRAG